MRTQILRCLKAIAIVGILLTANGAEAERELRIVATLSTFADIATQIAGERADVKYVASPRFNPHFIEPRPSDVLKVKRADLFLHGGLDLELWRGPLLDAAGRPDFKPGGSKQLDLSRGIRLLEVPSGQISRAEGDIHIYGNPHFWLDPRNAARMAQAIHDKLVELDPEGSEGYQKNLEHFKNRLQSKLGEWHSLIASFDGKELVAYHNSWIYFTEFAGLRVKHFLEPKPGIPPTPQQLRFIEGYVKNNSIKAILVASYTPRSAPLEVSKRSGAALARLCQNVAELEQCTDYLATIEYNLKAIAEVLGQ